MMAKEVGPYFRTSTILKNVRNMSEREHVSKSLKVYMQKMNKMCPLVVVASDERTVIRAGTVNNEIIKVDQASDQYF